MTQRPLLTAAIAFLLASPAAAMSIASDDFKDGAVLATAQIYPRCGGQNISPALSWSGTPKGTKSLVLTMIDASVKPSRWSHWIVVDLPPATTALARGFAELPAPAHAVASNFGDPSYDGPCPPAGSGPHRYEITIWAMPAPTTALAADMKATDLETTLSTTSIAHATIAGTVRR